MKIGSILKHLVLICFGCMAIYPLILLVMLSLKDTNQFYENRWAVTVPFHWSNYKLAWQVLDNYILNSVIVSSVVCILVILIASISAYPFARLDFYFKEPLFLFFVAIMMVPFVLMLVPEFSLIVKFRMVNTWWGLWLPLTASGIIFNIFVFRSFFASLPEEMFESARLDGASELAVLLRIVAPLSRAILSSMAALNLLGTWNEFVWPSMVLNEDRMKTLPIGLLSFSKQFSTDYGPLFAGYTIAAIPLIILFAFASNQFIEGLSSGAVKL
jgi:multiple sugar transport system permease protein/raffinose/stachyose/melibiose transport system permease protein